MPVPATKEIVVFLPGMLCGRWFWTYFWRKAGQRYEHSLELPGLYGPGVPLLTLDAEVEAYARQIKELAKGKPVALVAHSYGAQHALALAARRDLKIGRMVLVAPALGRWWMVAGAWNLLKWTLAGKPFREVFLTEEESAGLHGERESLPADEQPVGLNHAWAQVVAVMLRTGRGLWRRSDVPTLIIRPRGDRILVKKGMMGVETVEVEGGHFMFLAKRDVWEAIAGFLAP